MFKSYLKILLRNLMKNPMSSFINIFGLSVAIGICFIVYASLSFDNSIDRFHEHKNEVFLVTYFADMDGEVQQYGTTPRPLGEMLREDFTHIKKVCRVEDRNVVIKYEDKVFHERVRYSDPEFLQMFTFPLKWGMSNSLSDLNSIILSEKMAIKYFGNDNPVGQDILMKFDENNSKLFKITGVAEAFPEAHIIDFDFLINFENLRISEAPYNLSDWSKFVNATLIQVDDPAHISTIEQKMGKYKALQNEVQKDWPISAFSFESIANLHLNSGTIRDGISYDFSAESRIGLPVIAIFMLALACLNYINIAIVSAAKRLKEIGLRKVIGASRSKIIFQFLAENILITFFALVFGFIMAAMIFIPWFVNLTSENISLSLLDGNFWLFLGAVLLVTGVLSGIYPAFYISKFEAVTIFKGSVQFGKKNPATKIFLGIQLILACISITGAVMFSQNTTFQNNRSWGYNQKEALYVNVPDLSAFEQMRNVMAQNPNVLSTAGASHHLGKDIATTVVHQPENQYEAFQLSVDADYFEVMGLKLKEGRVFKEHQESDKQTIVVNEKFVKNLGLKDPVGRLFKIDSTTYKVIGVVEDFHISSFYDLIRPTLFKVANREDYRYLAMRARSGTEKEIYKDLENQWAALYPETPFQGGHQEFVWGWFFDQVDTAEKFFKVVAFIAVLLASLGLYGLVTLNVSGRVREFSIRIVLGAGLKNIAVNITKQYLILAAIALVVGAPASYYLMEANLNMLYAYPMPTSYSGVAIAIVILMLVLLAVVSTQILKVFKSKPIAGLKVE